LLKIVEDNLNILLPTYQV